MAETVPAAPPGATTAAAQRAPLTEVAVGALLVVTGVVVLVLPSRTLLFVGFALGVQLVLVGLVRTWALRAFALPRGQAILGYLLALLTVAAGVVCMVRPGSSLVVLAVFAGAGWIADGFLTVVAFATGSGRERGFSLSTGALTLVAGIALLAFPHDSLLSLAQVAGGFLVVFGGAHLLSGAARLRGPRRDGR